MPDYDPEPRGVFQRFFGELSALGLSSGSRPLGLTGRGRFIEGRVQAQSGDEGNGFTEGLAAVELECRSREGRRLRSDWTSGWSRALPGMVGVKTVASYPGLGLARWLAARRPYTQITAPVRCVAVNGPSSSTSTGMAGLVDHTAPVHPSLTSSASARKCAGEPKAFAYRVCLNRLTGL